MADQSRTNLITNISGTLTCMFKREIYNLYYHIEIARCVHFSIPPSVDPDAFSWCGRTHALVVRSRNQETSEESFRMFRWRSTEKLEAHPHVSFTQHNINRSSIEANHSNKAEEGGFERSPGEGALLFNEIVHAKRIVDPHSK